MGQTIDVDFDLLEKNIEKLKKLQKSIKEPKISWKIDLVKKGKDSEGDVASGMVGFECETKEYYKVISLLVSNTIQYLTSVHISLRNADKSAAQKIKEGE